MTTMPPEMFTTTTPTMTVSSSPQKQQSHQLQSLSIIQQSRSRFMINDILADGGIHQQANVTPAQQISLQRYLAQQQQQQKQFFVPISPEPSASIRNFQQQNQHLPQIEHTNSYANVPHAAALMALTPMQSLHQHQRPQHERELELDLNPSGADFDERSRSPFAMGTTSANNSKQLNGNNSVNDDQASTIDDSDSGKEDDGSSKSDNIMSLSKKQRKARTAFTDHQLQTLEKSFERQKYLSVQDRMELANKLELSDCQVKTWYQNRRTKWKRQTAVGLELLAEAGNYAAFQRLYGGSSPYLTSWPFPTPTAPTSAIDIYYRQAAAAATLQKPLTYRLYNNISTMSPLVPSQSVTHLGGFYNPTVTNTSFAHNGILAQIPRPQESPGSKETPSPESVIPPIEKNDSNKEDVEEDEDDAIEV